MKRNCLHTLIPIILLALLWTDSIGQHKLENPVSMGLGATGTTYIGDFNANFVNPANLMLGDRNNRFTISLLGLGVGAGGTLVDITTYNRYLTSGELLDAGRRTSMLDSWVGNSGQPGNLNHAGVNLGIIPLGMSWRGDDFALSLATRVRAVGNFGISRGMLELGFAGLDPDVFGDPRGVNAQIGGVTFTEISLGYAQQVYESSDSFLWDLPLRVYAGAAPKLLLGFYASTFRIQSDLQLSGDSLLVHHFDYSFSTFGGLSNQLARYVDDRNMSGDDLKLGDYVDSSPKFFGVNALGLGFDLGLTAEIDLDQDLLKSGFLGDGRRFVRMGLAFTDIGRMSFTDDAATFRSSGTLTWNGVAVDHDRLRDEFDSNLSKYFQSVIEDSIGTDLYLDLQREGKDRLSAALPGAMHLGLQFTAGKLTTLMDISKGFNREGVNNRFVSAGFGLEYRFMNILPLRFGFHAAGNRGNSFTAGLGLNTRYYDFDVGVMATTNTQKNGLWLAAGVSALKFRF